MRSYEKELLHGLTFLHHVLQYVLHYVLHYATQ